MRCAFIATAITHKLQKMKLKTLFALAIIALTTTLAMAEADWGVYEFTEDGNNPKATLYWISLTIDGKKVSGDITKYANNEMKKKVGVEKFTGKVLEPEPGLDAVQILVTAKSKVVKKGNSYGDILDVLFFTNEEITNSAVWFLKPNENLEVGMWLPLDPSDPSIIYKTSRTFGYVSPN